MQCYEILSPLPSKLALMRDSVTLFGNTTVSLCTAQLIKTWAGCLLSSLAMAMISGSSTALGRLYMLFPRGLYASTSMFFLMLILKATGITLQTYHFLEPLQQGRLLEIWMSFNLVNCWRNCCSVQIHQIIALGIDVSQLT